MCNPKTYIMAYKVKDKKEQELIQKVVRVVIKHEMQDGITIEELEKYANEGLGIARERYDPKRGFKFIPYAVWFIRQNIRNRISKLKA